jgi:hypothetical protein
LQGHDFKLLAARAQEQCERVEYQRLEFAKVALRPAK